MAHEAREGQAWTPLSNPLAKKDAIKLALGKMAVRRGARLEEVEYEVYSDDLMQFELSDVIATLDRIGLSRREEYQPVFPDSPTLVDAVAYRQRLRETRIRPEQLRPEVREALATARQYELGEGDRVPIGNLLEDGRLKELCGLRPEHVTAKKLFDIPVESEPCSHCSFSTSPQDSTTLFRLSDYYRKLAENAAERETKELALKEI